MDSKESDQIPQEKKSLKTGAEPQPTRQPAWCLVGQACGVGKAGASSVLGGAMRAVVVSRGSGAWPSCPVGQGFALVIAVTSCR